ncbi:hypothetical protein [Pseudoalteromonas distincta]|uniref:hypothetical protein n=1 Tax=Pseudoalteromonas distincta TaxID=77608 RepID=UPI0032E14E0C
MELSFKDIRSHLSDLDINVRELRNAPQAISVIGSDYISLSDDYLERNVLTFYAYGTESGAVDLVEFSLAKTCAEYEEEAVRNFKLRVYKMVKIITGHELTELEITDETKIVIGDSVLLVHEKPETEPKTVRVFIAHKERSKSALELRDKYLYSE